MKNIIKSAVVFALLLIGVAAFAGGRPKFDSFINGFSPGLPSGGFSGNSVALYVTNSSTNTYGESNLNYYIQGVQYGYTYATNGTVTLATNRSIGPAQWDAANGVGVFYVNITNSSGNITNTTGTNQLPPAIVDIPLSPDANGDPAQCAFTATFTSDGQTASNSLTFVLGRVCDGTYAGNNTASQISITYTPVAVQNLTTVNPTNAYTLQTNLPTTFTAGAKAIRLISVASTTNGAGPGTNLWLNQCGITQVAP